MPETRGVFRPAGPPVFFPHTSPPIAGLKRGHLLSVCASAFPTYTRTSLYGTSSSRVQTKCNPFCIWQMDILNNKKKKNGEGGYGLVVLLCDLAVEKPIMNTLFLPFFSFGVGGGGDALPRKSIIKDLIQCTTANNMWCNRQQSPFAAHRRQNKALSSVPLQQVLFGHIDSELDLCVGVRACVCVLDESRRTGMRDQHLNSINSSCVIMQHIV